MPRLVKISFGIIFITLLGVVVMYAPWKHEQRFPIKYDVAGYYLYLPAFIIHQDIYMKFLDNEKPPGINDSEQNFIKVKNGYTSKYHVGLSIMYLPFFLLAILLAFITGNPIDGYSYPFQLLISIQPIFYLSFSYWILYKTYLRFFAYRTIVIGLMILLFASHLFFYSTIAGNMPHLYLFFLLSVIMYYTDIWIQRQTVKSGIIILVSLYLIFIIRPTTVIVSLYPILLWMKSTNDSFFVFVRKNIKTLVVAMIIGMLLVIPLLIYWKVISGDWFLYTYRNESFDFLAPHIYEVLIGFRKGWLVYSPLFLVIFYGFYLMYKSENRKFTSQLILLILVLHVYIISSWWCWWYGGSLGMRTMIDLYPLLLYPILAVIEYLLDNAHLFIRISFIIFFTISCLLNFVQSYQYLKGILRYDGLTSKTYFKIFGRLNMSNEELMEINHLIEKDRHIAK